jgi:hypothetical protein
MPAKPRKTDWKRLAQEQGGTGTEILAKGTQSSEGNEGKFVPTRNLDDILKAIEANRKLRNMPKKKPSYHPGLKGLFGGGE